RTEIAGHARLAQGFAAQIRSATNLRRCPYPACSTRRTAWPSLDRRSRRPAPRVLLRRLRRRWIGCAGHVAGLARTECSLTTTRPIVRPNCLLARTHFTPAGSTNPIFCCRCCPCDRSARSDGKPPLLGNKSEL